MIHLLRSAGTLLLLLASPIAAHAQEQGPFRVGVLAPAAAACADRLSDAGADALIQHLSGRLQRPVQVCRFASSQEAGRALAASEVDFAALDAEGMAAAGSTVRSLLTPRAPGSIGRILTVAVTRSEGGPGRLSQLQKGRLLFGGVGPAHLEGPKAALADNGLDPQSVASEEVLSTPELAFAALKNGRGDVMVLHASAWQRVCRSAKPTDRPCEGYQEIFRGRERPDMAFGVRRDLDSETLHRLVGIMIALHLENRAAMDWLAPGAVELTPTEANALRPASGAS